MSKYIYQNPAECQRALRLIMEQMDDESESYNALNTAVSYLSVMQMDCNREKRERDEAEKRRLEKCRINDNKKRPIGIGDVVKLKNEEDDPDALQFCVTRIVENKWAECLCYDGAAYERMELESLVKTGKNYSEQLAGLLTEMCADMRGDDET